VRDVTDPRLARWLPIRVVLAINVEPALYRVGFGGVRVEDLFEVISTGCRTLTSTPKDLPCLPSAPTT